MTTQFEIDCALMAGRAYQSNRDPLNQFPIPQGWSEFFHVPDPLNPAFPTTGGFEAVAFKNKANPNQIVISYTGTDQLTDWTSANMPLAFGLPSDQLYQAAQYYLEVKAANPPGTVISFTGHSLGGGLAALMGILFDEKAVTFDQAPFASAAKTAIRDDLISYLTGHGYTAATLSALAPELFSYDGSGARSANVSGYYVQGEAMQLLPFSVLGSQTMLEQTSTGLGALGFVSLHSIALLNAFLENKSFEDVTAKLPDLLAMVFDKNLFANDTDPNTNKENLLDRLIRHQTGNAPGVAAADAMLARFTSDLWKLAQPGGLTLTDQNPSNPDVHDLSNALITFAMQFYYANTPNAVNAAKELFSTNGLTGGIQFDRNDVAETLAAAKGFDLYFKHYLDSTNNFSTEEQTLIQTLLPQLRDWFVQAGASGMTAADTQNRGDFMLGGSGSDSLTGGDKTDLLVGNAGADTLKGGKGNDTLIGGKDYDTYILNAGDGFDTVLDSDGSGVIKFGSTAATGSAGLTDPTKWKQLGTDTWADIQNGITYTRVTVAGDTQLFIRKSDSNVLVKGWSAGELGIALGAGAAATPPVTNLTLVGDHPAIDQDSGQGGIQPGYDAQHNLKTDYGQVEARQDILYGSAGNDLIQGLTGTDYLDGRDGNDLLEGGTGNDALMGGLGDDILTGGDGNDILLGDHVLQAIANSYDYTKNASLIANHTVTVNAAGVAEHSYQISIGSQEAAGAGGNDSIEGGLGDDLVFAGGGDDTVDGGDGADVVFGEGGQDVILGQAGNDVLVGDGYGAGDPYGDDYLSGGDGNDWLCGTGGNDYLDGGTGDDILIGDGNDSTNDGNDVLLGGDGNDSLYGGGGDDLLVGGDGADHMAGGAGDDTYLDVTGNDTIYDVDGNNTIIFATATGLGAGGLSTSAFTANDGSTGLQLNIALDNGETLKLESFFGTSATLQFANGDALDLETLVGENLNTSLNVGLGNTGGKLYGGASNDVLAGGAGDDTLAGHKGTDILQGGAGNDVYLFATGDGGDTITETGGSADVLRFAAGIQPQDIKLSRVVEWFNPGSPDCLRLDLLDASGSLTGEYVYLKSYFDSADDSSRVDRIEFSGGTVWTYADIQAQMLAPTSGDDRLDGFAGADVIDGFAGNDNIAGKAGDDVLQGGAGADSLSGAIGNDTLWGGAGNDLLYGGQGNDIYQFGRGDGYDQIFEVPNSSGASLDVLRLGSGVQPGDVTIYRKAYFDSGSLVVVIDGSDTQIEVVDYFASVDDQIERIEFDNGNGPVWTAADINAHVDVGIQNSMVGTASNDIFVVDHERDVITEAANSGTDTVLASRSYVLPANIENLTLTGPLNIQATGNALDNTLIGNPGDNLLDGKDGIDIAYGGKGDDWYLNVEQIVENAGEGNDTWYNPGGGTLPDNVENLYLSVPALQWQVPGYSSLSFPDINYGYSVSAIGNDLDNILVGRTYGIYGQDILDGRAGADTMVALNPAVTIYVDNPGDVVIGQGYEIRSTVDYGLLLGRPLPSPFFSAQILYGFTNRLNLIGSNAINGSGNGNDNVLISYLNQAANTLSGGAGGDTYVIGLNDHVIEAANEGNDRVYLWLDTPDSGQDIHIADLGILNIESYGLAGHATGVSLHGDAADNVLRVELSASYSDSVNLYGEGGNDQLLGGKGNDLLDGGTGVDTMMGGAGNDVYIVDNTDDQVIEYQTVTYSYANSWDYKPPNNTFTTSGGWDTVQSSVTYTLGANFENLTLTGTAAINGTGNELNNVLVGNSAANILTGGAGNDFYVFGKGAGQDTVNSYDVTVGKVDIVEFDATVAASEIQVSRLGNDLVLSISNTADTLTIQNYMDNDGASAYTVEQIRFQDGTIWDVATVKAILNNHAPVLTAAIPDQAAAQGGDFSYTVPANTFTDPDVGYALMYSATLSDGSALPSWLSFDALTQTFSGTPDVLGTLNVRVTARDIGNLTASDIFDITVSVQNLTLTGTSGVDILNGGYGNDTLSGLGGNDKLYGYAGNDTLNGGTGNDTLMGGTGDDTYIVDSATDVITENLNEGVDSVQSSVTYTLAANVESLILTGTTAINGTGNTLDNLLSGNSANNTLTGGAGNDRLDGGTGNDTMVGGTGNDTYVVNVSTDIVTENANEGTDTVESSVTLTLATNVENLILTGTAAINGTGNTLNNVLTGNDAANTLSGGTGADTMFGGAGNDIYVVDNALDVVAENLNDGTDLVQSSVTYTLANNVENLTLTGTTAINATGNALDNVLTGNSANNTLTGGAGSDRLDGGTGNDTMLGGTGNDTYVVNVSTDIVTENANEGTDTIESSATLTLAANVENLLLTGTTAINGTGNTLDNVLTGNSAVNTLTGGAGNDRLDGKPGADKMLGGLGDDTYVVDVSTDVITENLNEGTDTVEAGLTYTLGANVENLTLTGTAINGTGNTLNNVLKGNSAVNILTGAAGNDTLDGGAGADTLTGGTGNDTYVLGRGYAADTVVENDATAGNTDIAQFLTGVAADQIWFQHVGNNLEASIIGTADKLVVKDWYLASANHVEQFKTTDGAKTLIDSNVQNLVNAMASFAPPAAGQTTLPTTYQTSLTPVIAVNWQ